MSNNLVLTIIDKITSYKLTDDELNLAMRIANIFHDVWRLSWGRKNGCKKYTDIPYFVTNRYNIKTNVNVNYNDLPKEYTEMDITLIIFALKMVNTKLQEQQLGYFLINEYRRIVNTSERGGPKDVDYSLLSDKDKTKCIDIFNLCYAFKTQSYVNIETYG
jgi:hypothetical protein